MCLVSNLSSHISSMIACNEHQSIQTEYGYLLRLNILFKTKKYVWKHGELG